MHDLMDAFAIVLKQHPDARLEILGGHGAAPREYMVAVSATRRSGSSTGSTATARTTRPS